LLYFVLFFSFNSRGKEKYSLFNVDYIPDDFVDVVNGQNFVKFFIQRLFYSDES